MDHLLGRSLRHCTTVFTPFLGENSATLLAGSFSLRSSRRDVQYYLGEYPALPCVIPLHSLNDYALLKKISVSCIKKAANHRDVFCHLAFPTHPEARECSALSWGCIPAWLVAGCLHEELLALVQKVLLLLHYAEIRPEEKHMY